MDLRESGRIRSCSHMSFMWLRRIDLPWFSITKSGTEFLLVTLTQSEGTKEGIPSASGMVKLGKVGTFRARNTAGVPQPLETGIC